MGKILKVSDTDKTILDGDMLIVNKQDLNRGDILAVLDSYEKDELYVTITDDVVPNALYYLVETIDGVCVNAQGKQGNNLFKLLLIIAPEKEAELRYALLTHKDMLEVL